MAILPMVKLLLYIGKTGYGGFVVRANFVSASFSTYPSFPYLHERNNYIDW